MSVLVAQCRCCGQPLPADLPLRWDAETRTLNANGQRAAFTKAECHIVHALWNRRRVGGFLSLNELIDAGWADDPNGGPQQQTVSVQLIKIRKKLQPLGWTITHGNKGRPRPGFQLIPT